MTRKEREIVTGRQYWEGEKKRGGGENKMKVKPN